MARLDVTTGDSPVQAQEAQMLYLVIEATLGGVLVGASGALFARAWWRALGSRAPRPAAESEATAPPVFGQRAV